MASVSPLYSDNSVHSRMNRRSGIYDIDFSKMSINSPGPNPMRRNSSASYVNSALEAIPRGTGSSTPDSESRILRTPEPRLHRRNSLSASMRKFRSKVTHAIDRLNVSFSEYMAEHREHREHTVAPTVVSKGSRANKTVEKILSSGGIRRNKIAPKSSLLHTFKPKNLFKKRGNANSHDVDTISRSSSCSSLPSLASVDYHVQPAVPMETGSGRVLIYDDLEKSVVSHSFSDYAYDDVKFTEEADVHRSEDSNFDANQSWVSRVFEVPEESNPKFQVQKTLYSLNCSPEKSDESYESRSSCSKIVHPSWSNEQLDHAEGDYVVIKRNCPCRMQEEEEAKVFNLKNKNSLNLDETDEFMMMNQKEDVEKANSYVVSMYV
ncbi:uncharacterized protein LOC117180048 [Belonocnema kinseyi]|uniref:uncharacterized protein LOC117180048 n=1 Tax=Belonocnema kinseyi TaxID=2817044 RepID=UPI00143D6857|nr:uncharacterized protein LOC117180048 [Belonocnema kinseyi]